MIILVWQKKSNIRERETAAEEDKLDRKTETAVEVERRMLGLKLLIP